MASWVGMRTTATPAQIDAVVRAIRSTPIIDHHAHPLLKPDALSKHPLLSLTTEANGDAIHSATTSLPHLRAVRQLATALGCGYTWEAVVAAIEDKRLECPEDWTAECLEGIETVLVDDGLDEEDEANSYSWHDDYTRSRCKRIVRIEKVAGDIIRKLGAACDQSAKTGDVFEDAFDEWMQQFDTHILTALDDPDVVGFKSVICYRTGLDIAAESDAGETRAKADFEEIITNFSLLDFQKLKTKSLNDWAVHRTAQLIKDSASRQKKPIQFHTGLGDNDLSMSKASPSHLQSFIRLYETVPIVLLHAGYPFMRETGYLATVYENVYADIGEVFPHVSQDGQERILREILELCPWSKILWSTDGHWFPETYLLAVVQMREALETVLCDYVRRGHIGWRAAVDLVQDVLFKNANKLYHLELDFSELDEDTTLAPASNLSDVEIVRNFLKNQPTPDFVRICWNDFTAVQRMRMIPFRKFASLLNEGKPTDIGITAAVFSLIQNDHLLPGASPTGEYRLHPDFSSLKRGPIDGHISMNGEFRELSGARVPLCPRYTLQRAVEYGAENNLSFLLGFEIEFLLLERVEHKPGTTSPSQRYSSLTTDGHAWSVSRYFATPKIAALLRDMVTTLADMSIFVEQLHAESANGQFELILPPYPPPSSRHPPPHPGRPLRPRHRGRLQTNPPPQTLPNPAALPPTCTCPCSLPPHKTATTPRCTALYAGVLKHLRAITAFSYASPASYERATDGTWAGDGG
ncbi:hypothetical protein N0V88_002475 [Collariella sp. IMI 366227]|nr:hypothetical protein N0V88_002475 [Collariella sp. IMI 366227]